MQKFALVSRSHFTLVALLAIFACASFAGCNAPERVQNAKVNQECNDYLNQGSADLLALMATCNAETEPEKYLAGVVDIYAELLANLRSLDASGCSIEYRHALNNFIAYIEKLANLSQELQTLQQRITSEASVADAQRMIEIGEEFETLSNQVDLEAFMLKAAI